MKTTMSDKQATAELLAALVEVAIAHGRRHYSESGEPFGDDARDARVPAPGGFRHRRGAGDLKLARLALARVSSCCPRIIFGMIIAASAGSPLAPGPLAFPGDPRLRLEGTATPRGGGARALNRPRGG